MNQSSTDISVRIFSSFLPIYVRAKILSDKTFWKKIKEALYIQPDFFNPSDIPDIRTAVTGSSRTFMLYVHLLLTC